MRSSRRRNYGPCTGCAFCTGADVLSEAGTEARRFCSQFNGLKATLSLNPYLEVQLRSTEAAGFSAAGVLLFRRTGDGDVDLVSDSEIHLLAKQSSIRGGYPCIISRAHQ